MGTDLEDGVICPAPLYIKKILEIPRLPRCLSEFRRHVVASWHEIKKIAAQHTVEQDRMPAEPPGKTRRGTHDLGHQVEQTRMRVEQRKKLYAGGQALKKLVEPPQRQIWIRDAEKASIIVGTSSVSNSRARVLRTAR